MKSKNILIILSGYSTSGVGEQFLEAMLDGYDHSQIWRYSTVITETSEKNLYSYSTNTRVVPYNKYPGISMLSFRDYDKHHLLSIITDIENIVSENKIDLIWVFMNSWYTIRIASELVKNNIPVVTHIWDSPEYLAKKNYLTPSYRNKLMSAFDSALKGARKGITVSDSMSKIYKERYGLDSKPMVFCPPDSSWRFPKNKKTKGNIKIVFAGSLYAFKQWNRFLDAVELSNKSGQSRKISVTCIGNVSRWARKRKWVTYLPLKPIDEAADFVNEADIAYLPYWMDRSHEHFVKTAFPGKMSFYVASGTPVLFHGPLDSTPTYFLKDRKVGVACNSMEIDNILNSIDYLLSSEFLAQYKNEQKTTLEEVFHPKRCVEIFQDTLDAI